MELIFFILIVILCLFLSLLLIYNAVFKHSRSSLHSVFLIYQITSLFVNMEFFFPSDFMWIYANTCLVAYKDFQYSAKSHKDCVGFIVGKKNIDFSLFTCLCW